MDRGGAVFCIKPFVQMRPEQNMAASSRRDIVLIFFKKKNWFKFIPYGPFKSISVLV